MPAPINNAPTNPPGAPAKVVFSHPESPLTFDAVRSQTSLAESTVAEYVVVPLDGSTVEQEIVFPENGLIAALSPFPFTNHTPDWQNNQAQGQGIYGFLQTGIIELFELPAS